MARLTLKRLLKGTSRATLDEVSKLLGETFRVTDMRERTVYGPEEASGEAHPIEVAGKPVGTVRGGAGAARIAAVIVSLFESERQKRALADETLDRYKELTLLYDMGDELSHVLDIKAVAALVVDKAHRFLRCESAALYTLDAPKRWLTPIASVPEADAAPRPADEGIEGRVVASGQSEIAEGEHTVMCAPLRSGEDVIGVLRCAHSKSGWTAGDLKLLHALASNAAASIGHATLHHHQLQEQALRNQIHRFISADLVDAALPNRRSRGGPAAVMFVDLGAAVRSLDVAAEDVVESLNRAVGSALAVLLDAEATVQLAQSEKLVAVFPRPDGLAQSARDAVRAAQALVGAGEGRPIAPGLGVGITCARLDRRGESKELATAVSGAAAIQSEAMGRILVSDEIASALSEEAFAVSAVGVAFEAGAHEVRA